MEVISLDKVVQRVATFYMDKQYIWELPWSEMNRSHLALKLIEV